MKIISIEISNNKAIKCFNLELDGENLEITGTTGTGKTTAISALWDIFEKGGDMLTHGKKKGSVKIELSDGKKSIFAKRVNTRSSSTVTLTTDRGETISTKDFKKMISQLSVNPHKIMDMKPSEQTKTLLKSANLGDFDLDAADKSIADAEENRLNLKRQATMINPGERPDKVQRVDVSALIAERDGKQEVNAINQKGRDALQRLISDQVGNNDMVTSAKSELEELKKKLAHSEKRLENANNFHAANLDRINNGQKHVDGLIDNDLTEIDSHINNAQSTNDAAAKYEQFLETESKHEDATAAHTEADQLVKKLRADKADALDNAHWPIEGLSVEEGKVIYKDYLLENLGESQQILVCSALAIADIKSHELKVVRIDGVESMSSVDFKQLQTLFNGEGIQVLSTRVSRGDAEPQEIVIVDGEYGEGE